MSWLCPPQYSHMTKLDHTGEIPITVVLDGHCLYRSCFMFTLSCLNPSWGLWSLGCYLLCRLHIGRKCQNSQIHKIKWSHNGLAREPGETLMMTVPVWSHIVSYSIRERQRCFLPSPRFLVPCIFVLPAVLGAMCLFFACVCYFIVSVCCGVGCLYWLYAC